MTVTADALEISELDIEHQIHHDALPQAGVSHTGDNDVDTAMLLDECAVMLTDYAVHQKDLGNDSAAAGADAHAYRLRHLTVFKPVATNTFEAENAPPIELQGIKETMAEGDGFWRTCSGCHESNEGHSTGPFSRVFNCTLGGGCSECGGIGAIWDTTDYEAMAAAMMGADAEAPRAYHNDTPEAAAARIVCGVDPAPHLFELWWAEYMPDATQAEAWAAFQAAPAARNVTIAATPEKAEAMGPAFNVSKVVESDKFGGTTCAIKVHFHERVHAEKASYLLRCEKLAPGPYPQQYADQAELIDINKLEEALVWHGCSTPVREMMSWWVGREVNRLIDRVLAAKGERLATTTTVRAVAGGVQAKPEKCYSTNNEDFNHSSLWEALEQIEGDDGLTVGRVVYEADANRRAAGYYFDIDLMLEQMGEHAHEQGGEYADDFPDVSPDKKAELQKLISDWLDANVNVNFYTVNNRTEIAVTAEMIAEHRS